MAFSTVSLGLVGATLLEADAVVSTLRRKRQLRLTHVFDPCLSLAEATAVHLDAEPTLSLDHLLRRTDGVVIQDVRWMGVDPLLSAARRQRPALLMTSVASEFDREDLRRVQAEVRQHRTWIMPELSARWARSTLRLRELTATRLGAIESMEVYYSRGSTSLERLLVLDWCSNTVQSDFRALYADPAGSFARLQFRRLSRDQIPVTATIRESEVKSVGPFPVVEARVQCRHGEVHIRGEHALQWQAGNLRETETLTSDRTAVDVMCDLFGRRLVGGLVPVPDLADLIKAQEVLAAWTESQRTGKEVPLA